MKKIKEYPKIRHPFCQESHCSICLEDSLLLEDFLVKELNNDKKDWLGEYRSWLDNIYKHPQAETEWGWFHPDVFRPDILDKFIDYALNYQTKTK